MVTKVHYVDENSEKMVWCMQVLCLQCCFSFVCFSSNVKGLVIVRVRIGKLAKFVRLLASSSFIFPSTGLIGSIFFAIIVKDKSIK